MISVCFIFFFFSSRRRHTRFDCDWSSDVCSSDLDPDDKMRGIRKRLIISILVVGVAIGGIYGLKAGSRRFGVGFSRPTTQDFIVIARRYEHIVQAVYDYKAQRGVWPEAVSDLVSGYFANGPHAE